MSVSEENLQCLIQVAEALGDMLPDMVFLGGSTIGLYTTEDFQGLRATLDVDAIVEIASYSEYIDLEKKLMARGFRKRPEIDPTPPPCRFFMGSGDNELILDVMPTHDIGHGGVNRWYPEAIANTFKYHLRDGLDIRLINIEYLVATKFEAYINRGNNDPLMSHDLEDISKLLIGCPAAIASFKNAPSHLREYVSEQVTQLTDHRDFADISSYHLVSGSTAEERERLLNLYHSLENPDDL